MADLIAAPHSMPTVVEVVLEAMEKADEEIDADSRECRLVFILDYLWDHGYVIASRRRFWAKRITAVVLIAVVGVYIYRGINAYEPHALLYGVMMWILGVAVGAHVIAWLRPTWSRRE